MQKKLVKRELAVAIAAAFGTCAAVTLPTIATAAGKTSGTYVAGDFHNHTTCSDGSISMQNLVRKATGTGADGFGLDWFVQAGHGGNGNRNCTLVEDETLTTPAYPFITGTSPNTTWTSSIGAANLKGDGGGVGGTGNMWRWQSLQEYQYPLIEYLNAYRNLPLFLGLESVVPGHEHSSMSVITGQIPAALATATLPTTPGPLTARYTPLGNGDALAQWEYCFDRADTDTSRGDVTGTSIGNNWDCSVPGSPNAADPSWNATAFKLIPTGVGVGSGVGTAGHSKTLEALKWMAAFHPNTSYYVPAHLERAGPFSPDGNFGYNVEHLRDFNNAGPDISFGFETQPGHGASSNRGEYQVLRNTFPGQTIRVDSVGGTTYGGTGVYGAQVGGVWDALLGEGRNWWFFASSDWHNRGSFGPDDRRSSQDFQPGEYQRNYTLVKSEKPGGGETAKLQPQEIVDGLRTGNSFASSGQLIDRLSFIACSSPVGSNRSTALAEAVALAAAIDNTAFDKGGCATMGQKLVVRPGVDVVVAAVVRDPGGVNFSPYTFENPSLLQVGIHRPINAPVLDHIDLIRGMVSGYRTPGAADYAGEWPRNFDWLAADGTTPPDLSGVPAAAKNTSAAVLRSFSASGATPWRTVDRRRGGNYIVWIYRIPAVTASQYVRLRGTNMPPAVPFETDASGNPLSDFYTNASNTANLRIPCTTVHGAASQFDGCPDHLGIASGASPIAGQRAVSYDVAAWADLWFYSNPIYVEVKGGTRVAGVK